MSLRLTKVAGSANSAQTSQRAALQSDADEVLRPLIDFLESRSVGHVLRSCSRLIEALRVDE